ncbi:hypothetical protein D3C81_1387550 [compost metagenome]
MLKFTPGNEIAVTTVTLAVDKFNPSTGKREADLISITIWVNRLKIQLTSMTMQINFIIMHMKGN